MTLFEFLRKIRIAGADISRLKIRVPNSPNSWKEGYRIHSLRGNRLSIDTKLVADFQLHAGHPALKREVIAIRKMPLGYRKIVEINSSAILVVDLGEPI